MTVETAKSILSRSHPKGLNRFLLCLLAVNASADGRLPFGEADQVALVAESSFGVGRFNRIVRDLLADSYVSLDNDVLTVYAPDAVGGLGVGVSLSPPEKQTSLLPGSSVSSPGDGGLLGGDQDSPKKRTPVSEVLDFYDETFGKSTTWGEDDRREVRAALEIKSVPDLKKAILGNKLSGFHQGENDKGKKYNTLGHIVRGKKGKKTRRENIDYFIEKFEEHKGAGGAVRSDADPAIVKTRKEEIRRAHRVQGDEEATERARRAVVWLEERGIHTVFRDDGYPLWPEGGGDA